MAARIDQRAAIAPLMRSWFVSCLVGTAFQTVTQEPCGRKNIMRSRRDLGRISKGFLVLGGAGFSAESDADAIAGIHTLIDLQAVHELRTEGGVSMNKLTDYVKTAEAAEILGAAQNTLRKWAA